MRQCGKKSFTPRSHNPSGCSMGSLLGEAVFVCRKLELYSRLMRLNMLYFGVLKEFFGVNGETVEVPAETTVEGILSFSRERASNLRISGLRTLGDRHVWTALAVAVNREYADRTTMLRDGDEVALLPPVSGGKPGEDKRHED